MTVSAVDTLTEYAQAVLDVAEAATATTDAGVPDQVFLSSDAPSWDCCLVGSTMVSTEHGPVPIKELVPGQNVWSYEDGRLVLRPVLRLIPQGVKPVMKVSGRRRSIVGTEDHPMLRLKSRHARTHYGKPQEWDTEWVTLGEIERGDTLVSADSLAPVSEVPRLSNGSTLDQGLAWLLGLWIGDGCFNLEDGLCFFVHNGVRSEAIEKLRFSLGVDPRENSERIEIKSRELYRLWVSLTPRAHAPQKTVPTIIWASPPEFQRSFLSGYQSADGHRNKRGWMEYATASPRLASELRMLHMGLGDGVSNLAVRERTKPIIIKGKPVRNALPLHTFSVYPGGKRKGSTVLDYRGARRALPDERLGISTVNSVSSAGFEKVFDIEVEGSHCFVANGLIAHNCPALVVHVARLAEAPTSPLGPPEAQALRTTVGNVILATYVVTATRCISLQQNGLPTLAVKHAAAVEVQQDGWAIWNALRHSIADGVLFDLCQGAHFDFWTPLKEQGGCVGGTMQIRAMIPGIPNPPGT